MIRLITLDAQPRFSSIIDTRIQYPYFVHGILAKNNHLLAECHTVLRYVLTFKKVWLSILEMSRPNYVCTVCSEHFTRRYSGKRHNLNIHSGRSEIVPFIEYMAGRSSGKYLASHPSWYRKQRQLQVNRSYQSETVVADSSFRPEALQHRYPIPDASPYSQTPTIQQKLDELGLLLGKFSSPHDAYIILELAKFNLRQGDEGFLNERLQQFRTLDGHVWRPI
jgi:hypothetical protein